MKKLRFLYAFMIFVLLLTCCSCHKTEPNPGNESKPSTETSSGETSASEYSPEWGYSLYSKALDEAEKYAGKDIFLTGTINSEKDGEKQSTALNMTYRSQEILRKNSETKIVDKTIDHLVVDNTTNYVKTNYSVYYNNGKKYYKDNTQKYQQTIDRTTALPEIAMFYTPSLTQAAFSSFGVAHEGDLMTLSLSINADILYDQLMSSDSSVAYILGGFNEESTYSFEPITVNLSFNKNNQLCGYSLFCIVNEQGDINRKVSILLDMTYNHPCQNITVSLPNFSGYKEMYSSVIGGKAYKAMPEIIDTLFDSNNEKVEDYETQYKALCKKHSKSIVDSVLAWYDKQP